MLLHLRVFGDAPAMDRVVGVLSALLGVEHLTRTDAGDGAGHVLVTADLEADAADSALVAVHDLGVPPGDV